MLRSGRLGVRPLPPDHGVRGHVPGDRAGSDAASPRAAHQDRSPRCPKTRPPVAGGGADSDPRARRGGGSRPRPGAVSRGGAARCRALAASPPEAARSARPTLVTEKNWTQRHWSWIRAQRFALRALQRAFEATVFGLEQALARQAELDREIEALAQTAPYRDPVGWLRCFHGIGTLSAMVLLAEIVDFQRFRRPRELMAHLGLVPSEYSSGETHRRGALTKAGNTHARRVLVGAGWHYRHRPTVGRALASRSQAQPDEVVGQAWRAQQRLHRRYRHLVGHGKRPPVAVAAIARELVGFLWAAMTRRETRRQVA